jgi:hypothetical protein
MHPKNPQMSEGDKLERANNTLLGNDSAKAKELRRLNEVEHATRTVKSVRDLDREVKKDPEAAIEASSSALGRAKRGEPSKYRTSKDL